MYLIVVLGVEQDTLILLLVVRLLLVTKFFNNLILQWTKIDINKTINGGYNTQELWIFPIALTEIPVCILSTIFNGSGVFIVSPINATVSQTYFLVQNSYYTSSHKATSLFALCIGY